MKENCIWKTLGNRKQEIYKYTYHITRFNDDGFESYRQSRQISLNSVIITLWAGDTETTGGSKIFQLNLCHSKETRSRCGTRRREGEGTQKSANYQNEITNSQRIIEYFVIVCNKQQTCFRLTSWSSLNQGTHNTQQYLHMTCSNTELCNGFSCSCCITMLSASQRNVTPFSKRDAVNVN